MHLSVRKVAAALGLGALVIGSSSVLAVGVGPIPPIIPIPLVCPGTTSDAPACPGFYKAHVTVIAPAHHADQPGCGYWGDGPPVPDYIYYYPGPNVTAGPGVNGGTYFVPYHGSRQQLSIEWGYNTPSKNGANNGTANAGILGLIGQAGVVYAEQWTFSGPASFAVTGTYTVPNCKTELSITYTFIQPD
jgi:hypothetical protein